MAGYKGDIVSWRGVTAIQGASYRSDFIRDDNIFDGSNVQPIESQEPGRSPTHVRTQPQGDSFLVEVEMLGSFTQATLDTLKMYFSPLEQSAGDLVFTPEGGVGNRRISCIVEGVSMFAAHIMHVRMRTATGYQEAATATTDSHTLTASGQTDALVNDGNLKTYPTITITPGTVMADTSSWIKRRRVHIANRSELNFSDPVGDGWPVDLTEDAWDTDALNTASKVLSSLNDVRVILKGREIPRWMDPATDNATSKTWVNMTMRGRKTATLAANINNSVTTLSVNNSTLLSGWPPTGFFLLNTERIQYTARTSSTLTIVRGSGNTTAASHLAGDTLYWVEHPFLDIIYHYDNAGDPLPPDDRKPRISLPDSTNSSFKWTSAFLNSADRRSAAWQPLWTDDGFTSDYITLATVGGVLQFKDILPTAERPNYNNVYMDFPVPALGNFTFDSLVQYNMLLHAYGIDFLGGKERLLEAFQAEGAVAASAETIALSLGASRLRLNGRIGALTGYRDDTQLLGVGISVGATNIRSTSVSFLLEKSSRITQFLLRIKRESGFADYLAMAVALDGGDVPDHSGVLGDLNRVSAAFVIPNASIPTSYGNVFAVPDEPLTLSAGRYHLVLYILTGTDNDIILNTAVNRTHPSIWSTQFASVDDVVAFDDAFYDTVPVCTVYTDETEAQSDAPVETEDYISLDDLVVPFDTSRTPKIVFAPEEVCYLLQTRITNSTTGAYLDIGPYPMKLTNSVVIDCAAKTVTDSETGTQIPFILNASDPSEWLTLVPGSNTITFTEVGVVSTAYAHSFRSRWL
jgi:hypothetical protein